MARKLFIAPGRLKSRGARNRAYIEAVMNGELQVTRLYRRVVRGRLVLEYDERPGRAAPPLAAPGRAAPGRAR